MWLVETMGADAFREKIGEYMGVKLRTKVEEKVSADKKALIGGGLTTGCDCGTCCPQGDGSMGLVRARSFLLASSALVAPSSR